MDLGVVSYLGRGFGEEKKKKTLRLIIKKKYECGKGV